jgi:hypothetical protein
MARDEPGEHVKRLPVAALAGIQLRYTGDRLSQRDADVFLHLVARANTVPLGQPAHLTAHSLLLDLGWDTNSRGYVRLRDSILNLRTSAVECEWTAGLDKRLRYAGSLIGAFAWKDEVTGCTLREWAIRLEPNLIQLFHESTYSLVNLRARRGLCNHELAKWLYACLSTHCDGVCVMRAAKIRELCGSTAKTLFGFRRTLRQALNALLEHQLIEGMQSTQRGIVSGSGLYRPQPAHRTPSSLSGLQPRRPRLLRSRSTRQDRSGSSRDHPDPQCRRCPPGAEPYLAGARCLRPWRQRRLPRTRRVHASTLGAMVSQ